MVSFQNFPLAKEYHVDTYLRCYVPCYLIILSGFLKIFIPFLTPIFQFSIFFYTHYGICFSIEYLVSTKFCGNIRRVSIAFSGLNGGVGGSWPAGMPFLPAAHLPLTLHPSTPSFEASPKDAIVSTTKFENLCLKKKKGKLKLKATFSERGEVTTVR